MTDRDRKELAEVFSIVLDSRLDALRTELAGMVVTTIECVMEDLALILNQQTEKSVQEFMRQHGLDADKERQHKQWMDRVLK